jgi:biotin operon repressor
VAVRPNSQNARILRALADGRWHTVANIHRKSGTSRLNSRISELRKHGYVIEHETIPQKTGSLGHKYRLLNPPTQTELATLVDLGIPDGSSLPRREVPRDSTHRYRIYRMVYDELDLVATATTAEDVGVALITLGSEGEFNHSCAGILDTHGTDEIQGSWILNPWDTTP